MKSLVSNTLKDWDLPATAGLGIVDFESFLFYSEFLTDDGLGMPVLGLTGVLFWDELDVASGV